MKKVLPNKSIKKVQQEILAETKQILSLLAAAAKLAGGAKKTK